jgi:hypothetical protein
MVVDNVIINLNMFDPLIENIIMGNMNNTSIVAVYGSSRGERHPYFVIAIATKEAMGWYQLEYDIMPQC